MDSTVMTVRPAAPGDEVEVIRLAALMYEAMGIDASDGRWRRAAHDALRSRLGIDTAVFVVDEPGSAGRLAASGAGTIARRLPGPGNPKAGVGYIQWVSTDPAWQRRGFARQVIVALLDWYEKMGVPSVELHATADGENIYRLLGFAEGPYPALRLRRDLPRRPEQ